MWNSDDSSKVYQPIKASEKRFHSPPMLVKSFSPRNKLKEHLGLIPPLRKNPQELLGSKQNLCSPPVLLNLPNRLSLRPQAESRRLTLSYSKRQLPKSETATPEKLSHHHQNKVRVPSFFLKRPQGTIDKDLPENNSKQEIKKQTHEQKDVFQSRASELPYFYKYDKKFEQNSREMSSQYARSSPKKSIKISETSNKGAPNGDLNNNKSDLLIPSIQKVPTRTKSVQNLNVGSPKSKVPSFIREKGMAKSCNPSCSSTSSNQIKVNLAIMLKTVEVESVDKSVTVSENSESNECGIFNINIKPARKKRSLSDFELVRELGQGSFGKAYLALQKNIHLLCVLKVIPKQKLSECEQTNLLRQIKFQFYLNHMHLTSLYGLFDDDEHIYLIMELLPTGTLKETINQNNLGQKKIAAYVLQLCKGIEYMHQRNILHRDIKPENIFTFGTYIKLGDFGCAVFNENTRTSFVGSPCYLSPEQLKNQQYDEKVDIWEIGVLTYEMLFRKCPFEKDILEMIQGKRNVQALSELSFPSSVTITPEAKDFLSRCLDKDQNQRMSLSEVLSHSFLSRPAPELQFFKLM